MSIEKPRIVFSTQSKRTMRKLTKICEEAGVKHSRFDIPLNDV